MRKALQEYSTCLRLCRTTTQWSRRVVNNAFGDFEAVSPRRVVITGMGLVSPLGIGIDVAWDRLLQGQCGIQALSAPDIPKDQRAAFEGLPAKIAGLVKHEELEAACKVLSVPSDSVKSARFIRLALTAAAEAIQDGQWSPGSAADRGRTGVAVGSGMSATTELATAAQAIAAGQPRRLSPFVVPRLLANMAAGAISMHYSLQGPNHSASTACTTGAHSIGDAFNFIRHRHADVMLAGGTEACVDAVGIASFARMRALETRFNANPREASRPFDAQRGGFVMGEGAGILLLEELEHARKRNARIYAEVRGYGLSGDAHHITQPAPDGRGAMLAMQRALAGSGVEAGDVAYINAHATSTPLGDAVEAAAISQLWCYPPDKTASNPVSGSALPDTSAPGSSGAAANLPLVSSTKGATGHLLGAAGAVEAIFTVKSLITGNAPPTLNLDKADPSVLGHNLVAKRVQSLRNNPKAVMSNSFGFGGTNASLLFTVPPC